MKVLSCKQPWASMLIEYEKCIETRSRNTSHRGFFVIHSSKQPDKGAMEFWKKSNPLNGYLLGIVELYKVIKYEDSDSWVKDKMGHKCYWIPDEDEFPKYGYLITPDVIKFKNPIPYKGNLGFWNIPLTEFIEEIPREFRELVEASEKK